MVFLLFSCSHLDHKDGMVDISAVTFSAFQVISNPVLSQKCSVLHLKDFKNM